MSKILQRLRRGWNHASRVSPLLVWLAGGMGHQAAAHELFASCIQHSIRLVAGARHIDVTLELTFFEEWSARERGAMDADGNRTLTRSELDSYLKKRAAQLAKQVKFSVAGRELPLILLYDPEIDLLANDQTGPAHHRLRVSFFVPTPAELRANDELVVEDHLWPDAKVLPTIQAEGRDDCKLTTEISVDPALTRAQPTNPRMFKFRCLKPPQTKSDASRAPAASSAPFMTNRLALRNNPQANP